MSAEATTELAADLQRRLDECASTPTKDRWEKRLRQLSLADRDRAVQFIGGHFDCMSAEGLRYAVEKMPAPLDRSLLAHPKRHCPAEPSSA